MKKESKAFAIAQQVGKSLFLPIAILPFAGILLGIGSSFTNQTTIATYGLEEVLRQGTGLYSFMLMLSNVGSAIFNNLALIFALAVALGMAKKEKGVAVLSAGIFYIVMLVTINTLLCIDGSIVDGVVADTVKDGAISSVLGIQTLQMGVFGGIVAGIIAAGLCNRFYKQELPSALSFFAGTRFVPIISILVAILTGFIQYLFWPLIQNCIYGLGTLVQQSGYYGTFVYGMIERALIPFGLHHIFYMPFWQTGVGGTQLIDGVLVSGAQNIFFAQLASKNTVKFSIDACRFLSGKYPFMMGGLPGAALAMYVCAKKNKRKEVASLLTSVALTSFLTGITEPIEFTFLFLAPGLYVIHVILAGISFVLCHMLNICVGTTFSCGLIDFVLYGVLPGNDMTNFVRLIILIGIYFVVYFIIFAFFIKIRDLKTPGREDDDQQAHFISKQEYQNLTGVGQFEEKPSVSQLILKGVGGAKNIVEIDCCATRLRLTLVDSSKINEAILKQSGASGVVLKGDGVQIVYGPQVTIIKSNFEEYIEAVYKENVIEEEPVVTNDTNNNNINEELTAFCKGKVLDLSQMGDEVFANKMMGDGIVIDPSVGELYSPVDGKVSFVFPTKHAVGIISDSGLEIMLHIGLDTVKLEGKYFETFVNENQVIKKGDKLVNFDIKKIIKEGYSCLTALVICKDSDCFDFEPLHKGKIEAKEALLKVTSK